MTGDVEERFEFERDRSSRRIALDLLNQLLLLFGGAQIMGSYGTMDGLAIAAIVLSRDVGSDEFPLGEREGAGAAHENLRHFPHGRCDFGAKEHRASWARYAFREWDVWHGRFS
jgi:hypothetical protein